MNHRHKHKTLNYKIFKTENPCGLRLSEDLLLQQEKHEEQNKIEKFTLSTLRTSTIGKNAKTCHKLAKNISKLIPEKGVISGI